MLLYPQTPLKPLPRLRSLILELDSMAGAGGGKGGTTSMAFGLFTTSPEGTSKELLLGAAGEGDECAPLGGTECRLAGGGECWPWSSDILCSTQCNNMPRLSGAPQAAGDFVSSLKGGGGGEEKEKEKGKGRRMNKYKYAMSERYIWRE